ncbi:amidase family protein [Granulicoccus sp. GXG6511]|uniref:amidase family protein n=1 Tax=Granulicoccus sp. GXG6511 TaxID=3381351 RepID=UPI003D7E5E11
MHDDPAVWRALDAALPTPVAGPLVGLRLAVTDLFAVVGQRLGAGSPGFLAEAAPEPASAGAVDDLVAAGAAPVGITQCDEFAYALTGVNPHYGTPANPAAPDRISGGSSSGAAAALALDLADIGLGTDTAGSIRVPAAYQGLFGLRTTHDAVSRAGMFPLAPPLDAVGWLTRDALTLARVTNAVLPGQGTAQLDRIAISAGLLAAADDDITDAVWRFVDSRMLGLPRREIDHDLPLDHWRRVMTVLQGFEAWRLHGEWLAAHPGVLGPEINGRFRSAAAISAEEYAEASAQAVAARTAIRALVGTDVLVIPTAATVPPRRATPGAYAAARIGTLNLTCLASLAGLPAVSVPLRTAEGMPAGACLIGPPHSDRALVALATVL